MQGPLNVPPLFQINREEIVKPVATAQVVDLATPTTKQPVDLKEMELNPPNKTLYVNRLNEKVMVEEMRQTLYSIFSQCGKVLDIIVKKNILMRGQAFILMDDEESAIKAQQTYHNTQLYDKVMKVNFAKEKSYFFAKQEGVYEEKEKLPMSDKIKEHKKKISDRRYREMLNQKQQREAPTISMPLAPNQMIGIIILLYFSNPNQPNKVLFVEGLHLVDFINLEQHFRNFYGFREFRGIKPKGVAFVEFEDELQATHCLNELNGSQFEDVTLQISYQKK